MIHDASKYITEPYNNNGYAHEYDRALAFFEMLCKGTELCTVENCIEPWAVFIAHSGHCVGSVIDDPRYPSGLYDHFTRIVNEGNLDPRHYVEVVCGFRPELVHALYLLDTDWSGGHERLYPTRKNFPVTCNGSFFRPEVEAFREKVRRLAEEPNAIERVTKALSLEHRAGIVFVPCAATKPYPAPLHSLVRSAIPDDWEIVIATGVLGVVPEKMWDDMPHYDSGLPNEPRVENDVEWYARTLVHGKERVVVYCDFYAHAVHEGLRRAGHSRERERYPFGHHRRDSYSNLCSVEAIDQLRMAVAALEGR